MTFHNVIKKGDRLDIYMMSLLPDHTRSKIQSLIKLEKILIDGKPSKPSHTLKGTESISYTIDILSNINEINNILSEEMNLA